MGRDTETFIRSPAAGDCYRAKRDVSDSHVKGDLAIITEVRSDGRVSWVTPRLVTERVEHLSDPAAFVREWEWVPNADEVLKTRVDEAMSRITEVEALSVGVRTEIGAIDPHVVVEEGVLEGALVPVVGDVARMRSQIGRVRNDVAKMSLDLKGRQSVLKGWMTLQRKRVEAVMKAQMDALLAKVGDLNGLIERAEEAIWTINLYLGKDEQIVQIKKGKPASKDTKISIRQRVLFADEECAVSAEHGGIDHMSIERFDEWLMDPKNRRQVLPEEKGVVAFKPRRHKKDYGRSDSPEAAWVAAAHHAANKKTYFLMVNGENVYRVCTDLEVTSTLIPTENEVSDLFFETTRDRETGELKREPVYPGDKRYMDAMGAATDLKKHYLRILLFLQGLIDRTVVFAPLPAPRLNLLDRRVYADHLNFVTDAEKLLPDGRISFEDWLSNVNSTLDVGCRIMGSFHSWSNGLRQFNMERGSGNERLSPPRATMPEDLCLHTIEGKDQGMWFFRYERKGETIWRQSTRWERKESGEAKRRATCRLSPNDDFILNFDAAEVGDMEFYLQDRTNRSAYAQMFPLLKKAIALKEAEAKEEAPFRDLLERQIANRYGVSAASVRETVSDLVSWWKLKNRTHRALLSDDAKAFRMIVAEYGRRVAQEESFDQVEAERFIARLPSRDHLLVAYNRDGNYVVLCPSGKNDVFVDEEEWSPEAELLSRSVWQVVERKRLLTWKVVYESERWSHWKVDARASDYLTDDERRSLVTSVRADVVKKVAGRVDWYRGFSTGSSQGRKPNVQGVLCIKVATKNDDNGIGREKISFFVWRDVGFVPERLLVGDWRSPEVEKVDVAWEKKKGVVKPIIEYSTSTFDTRHMSRKVSRFAPWERECGKGETYESDVALVKRFDADVRAYRLAVAAVEVYRDLVFEVVGQAQEAMSAVLLEKQKAAFLAEYEYEELWDEHVKTARVETASRSHSLISAVTFLLEKNPALEVDRVSSGAASVSRVMKSLDGWTFKEIFNNARTLGWKPRKKNDDGGEDDAGEEVAGDEDLVPMKTKVSFDEKTKSHFVDREGEARVVGFETEETDTEMED